MNPALTLAAARIVIGAGSIAAPSVGAKLFRLDPIANQHLPYMTRLFGSRELILGAATLLASGRTRRNLILAGVFADATDAVAGALAHKEGAVPLSTAALLTAPSVAAVAAGLAGVRGR